MKKLILFSLLGLLSLAAQAQSSVSVQVENLKNDKGVCRVYLFDQAAYFPNQQGKAIASKVVRISSGKAALTFENISAGRYAISVIHDENNNGKLDSNFLGIPTESYGASKNALPSMSMPSFEANAFEVAGQAKKLAIKVK